MSSERKETVHPVGMKVNYYFAWPHCFKWLLLCDKFVSPRSVGEVVCRQWEICLYVVGLSEVRLVFWPHGRLFVVVSGRL